MDETRIYCDVYCCTNNCDGRCSADTIHLHGVTPDADNVLGCSEFEQALKDKQ